MQYKHIRSRYFVMVVLLSALTFFALSAQADEVIQNVSVSASSGSNGENEAALKVKTIVNGEVVEDYEEVSNTGDLFYTSTYDNESNSLETEVRALATSTVLDAYTSLQQLLRLLEQLTQLLQQQSLGD